MSLRRRHKRVGEALIEDGAINEEQLQRALMEQARTGEKLGALLVDQGIVSGQTLVHSLAKCMGIRGCHLRHGLIDPSLIPEVGEEECEKSVVIPMFKVAGVMTVAMQDPQSLPTIDRLRRITDCDIRPVLALEGNILEYIRKYKGGNVDVDEFLMSLGDQDLEVVERESVDEGPETDLDKMVAGSPIVNLVNIALLTAVKDGASDIHIEPDKRGTRIRYRIDGVLRDLMNPPPGMHASIVSRLKVIGKMDIAVKRLPQEGRVRIVAEGREVDLRMSSMPTLLGEKIVARVLDKSNLRVRLEDLGFRDEDMLQFRELLDRPHGLLLVTGPTGSGKTTTLYSALDQLRTPERNILTVEDPVEYQVGLVNQIQVNEQIGLSFSRALRSILRQDPDTIMIGEIRDEDTARVAVQASLTGHLVLATLHTNDAPGAVARLVDMGIESYLLSGAIIGAVAQRLLRKVCPQCASKYYPSEQALHDAGLSTDVPRSFRKGAGCQQCHDSGFIGRIGVYELMTITPELRKLVHIGAPSHELRVKLRAMHVPSLREEAVRVALDGITSLEEALRVTHVDGEEEPEKIDEFGDESIGAAA
ncbi:MAG: type II/IV secretion system protein [Phycisphaera sp.]|nr:MAG: type II/IV secretion system protein [Phycisphaera sp.]